MEPYTAQDIEEVPLSSPYFRAKVERFLEDNGLRPEVPEFYYTISGEDGSILGGAGLDGDVIKCVAVSRSVRSEGLMTPLISHIISEAGARGVHNLKAFTKPGNEAIFKSLGFNTIASAPKAILMENGRGLEDYCSYLASLRQGGSGTVVVMNANPFTLGHQYLLEQASALSDNLYVIPVAEDTSEFTYADRLEMIRRGSPAKAVVAKGSAYQISAATFPTYFLKDLSDASETQMRLDIDLFGRHIAPALGATLRVVGSEPSDPLTARYNALMKEMLPAYGIKVSEIRRLKSSNGRFIRGARVRELLSQGRFHAAAALTPPSSHPFLIAQLAGRALRLELDAPLKPGLVCPESTGAHNDMDYTLMLRSISALRPFWSRMALADSAEELRQLGIDAEAAMLEATGGVNTHRGAIFALGLTLHAFVATQAASHGSNGTARGTKAAEYKALIQNDVSKIAHILFNNQLSISILPATAKTRLTHGQQAHLQFGARGARQMALEGYKDLFTFWQPYYHGIKKQPYALQRTLIGLIASLDDTCIIHRAGYERSKELRDQAADIFAEIAHREKACSPEVFSESVRKKLESLCRQYAEEGISPGGAADMLALTIFIDSLLNN